MLVEMLMGWREVGMWLIHSHASQDSGIELLGVDGELETPSGKTRHRFCEFHWPGI
jgi:hypothetical protein